MTPRTRYPKSGDVNIAYQVIGIGPRDLILVAGQRIGFQSRGTRTLKGVPGEWPLFAATAETA